MQIEFSGDSGLELTEEYRSGWLEKRGSARKTWRTRYFYLAQGSLKYYSKGPASPGSDREGVDLRSDIDLLGGDVSLFEDTQLHLIVLQNDKKTIFQIRTKSNDEANQWYVSLTKQIRNRNIQALRNHSRIPEVIEWYYQHQSELSRKHAFLTRNAEVNLHYLTGTGRQSTECVSTFNVSLNEERTGLVLSILATGKKFNRTESINNGRIVLLADIVGAEIPAEGWVLDADNRFRFSLITKEDDLSLDMEANGVTWLQAVRELSIFMKLPKPSARSTVTPPPRTVLTSATHTHNPMNNTLIEFSANSGAIYACASDIPLLLEGLHEVAHKSSVILEIGARINWILKLIPELKSNKEAALIFGERIEEVTRALGDPEVGILFQARDNDKSLLNFHLTTLHGKLSDVINFLTIQSRPGWLLASLTANNSIYSSSHENAKAKFDHFDHEIVAVINALIKAMGIAGTSSKNNNNNNGLSSNNNSITGSVKSAIGSHTLALLEKREYSMAIDVRKSIEALGGIEAIYRDAAKERALARLIQCDGQDVHLEIVQFMRMIESGGSGAATIDGVETQRSSFSDLMFGRASTHRTSASAASYYRSSNEVHLQPHSSGGIWRYLCCCARKNKTSSGSGSYNKSAKKSGIQLEEPLVS